MNIGDRFIGERLTGIELSNSGCAAILKFESGELRVDSYDSDGGAFSLPTVELSEAFQECLDDFDRQVAEYDCWWRRHLIVALVKSIALVIFGAILTWSLLQ